MVFRIPQYNEHDGINKILEYVKVMGLSSVRRVSEFGPHQTLRQSETREFDDDEGQANISSPLYSPHKADDNV